MFNNSNGLRSFQLKAFSAIKFFYYNTKTHRIDEKYIQTKMDVIGKNGKIFKFSFGDLRNMMKITQPS